MGFFTKTDYTFDCPPGTTCTGRHSGAQQFADELIDPPFVDQFAFCGCQHVTAANAEHCLQGVERSGPAQGEGFAQFFTSKVWNNRADNDCTFVYYKEFFDSTCRALDPSDCENITVGTVTGVSTLPPFGISCRSPSKWRNAHCPISAAAEMGTELDWMGFLWNLNTVDPLSSPMSDVWLIYRHACNPPPAGQPPPPNPGNCAGQRLSWNARPTVEVTPQRACTPGGAECLRGEACLNAEVGSSAVCVIGTPSCVCKLPAVGGILDGATRLYATDQARLDNVAALGDAFGVSQNLAP